MTGCFSSPTGVPPIQPIKHSMGPYQDPSHSNCPSQRVGPVADCLHRQHLGHGRVEGNTEKSGTGSHLSAGKPGVCDKLQKVRLNLGQQSR